MNIFKSGEPIDLREHMLASYRILRVVLFIIALSFPWVLGVGGYLSRDRLGLQPSMSDYYHANAAATREHAARAQQNHDRVQLDAGRGVMRNWFVGVLFGISALLIVYKGYRPAENVALNLAGFFAVLVALFPNAWDQLESSRSPSVHSIFAVCFFLCIAYVCIFCASATLPLVKDEGRRAHYRRIYKLTGYVMAVSPAVAYIVILVLGAQSSFIFFAEVCGVYAFAAYWLVKTLEIRETDADRKAARGEIQLSPGAGVSDAVRELPVQYVQGKAN
jgi:hypothetical protein